MKDKIDFIGLMKSDRYIKNNCYLLINKSGKITEISAG